MTKQIEKVTAFKDTDASWTLTENVQERANELRKNVFRKYLGITDSNPSYTNGKWRIRDRSDAHWSKSVKKDIEESFDEGYKVGYNNGADAQRDEDLRKIVSFFDDIQRELKKIDDNVKELEKA